MHENERHRLFTNRMNIWLCTECTRIFTYIVITRYVQLLLFNINNNCNNNYKLIKINAKNIPLQ